MRIGVTGIFASGKGTVCGFFRELGAEVIDTDMVAREIVEPGAEGLSELVSEFSEEILDDTGFLDRRKFANIVFKNRESVEKLNSITHPLILKLVMERSSSNGIYFINTPLLFESGFNEIMDKNIVVVAETDQAVKRGIKRDNISEKEIRERLNHQIPLNEKIKMADYVIDNSRSLENTKGQVADLWKNLTEIRDLKVSRER